MPTLNEARETFKLSNIAEGKAEKTVSSYDDRIIQFAKVMGVNTPITSIATNEIRQYLAERRKRLSKATVEKKRCSQSTSFLFPVKLRQRPV